MAPERVNQYTLRVLREIGLPDISDEQLDALAGRLLEAFAREQEQEQVGADPRSNVGGTEWPDNVEDGAPVMLDNITEPQQPGD